MEMIAAVPVPELLDHPGSESGDDGSGRDRLGQAESRHREETANLRGRLERAETARSIIEAAKEQLTETFQATAAAALRNNNETFLSVAQEGLGKTLESARSDLRQRHEQFENLVKPLSGNYRKLNPNIETLVQQSQALATETGKLRGNRQTGSWGKIQLRRLVELAGMLDHCDFTEQETIEQETTGGASGRPDLTVKLPGNRTIIVDAKTSMGAFLETQGETGSVLQDKTLRDHAAALKAQVEELARKKYGDQVKGSPDFTVMFVPRDQFLSAALQADPGLVQYAMTKRVVIATPSTLISLLWAVANGWQNQRLTDEASAIQKAGENLHESMQTFLAHYLETGKQLERAVTAYNKPAGTFDSRVAPRGRRFSELVKGDEAALPELAGIDTPVSTSKQLPPEPLEEKSGQMPAAAGA